MTSYITELEAEEYFAAVLDTGPWDDADTARRTKALLAASMKVDLLEYIDDKAVADQEHAFPRTGQDEVPERVKWAVAEIALKMLDGIDGDEQFRDNAVSSEGYSSVRVAYKDNFYEMHALLGLPSKKAYDLLSPWLVVAPETITLIRTT